MMRCIAPFVLTTAFASAALAQDNPNTILVMDGSGSMWGQIDGVAKITIAQDVVNGLMATIPADQNIGLTVYGHRERGNCTDIETIVAPGPNTRDAIRDAVNAIKPLGKTPMTDSIVAAAEALRYTEDSATVILVSDGVETCNPDPCAAMRLLEEAAIDFTAHVVGFDVGSDAAALAQMQCIADETGGQFLTADNAEELSQALQTVSADPEPVGVTMTFSAVIGDDAQLIQSPVLWDINSDDGLIGEDMENNPLTIDILEGAYVATAYSLEYEQTVNVDFTVIAGGTTAVTAVFEEPIPSARLVAPSSAPVGSTIQVGWDGPGNRDDFVGIGTIDAIQSARWDNYTYVREGNPIELLMPTTPGDHVIRYFYSDNGRLVIAQAEINLTPVAGDLKAPAQAEAGSTINVGWVGPDYQGDFIGIGAVGAEGSQQWENYESTRDGSPAALVMPTTPGDYLIQYFYGQDRNTLVTTPIQIIDVVASISAPATAEAGSEINVTWTGPNYDRDFIGIGKVGATGGNQWENYTRTSDGSTVTLLVPTEPGDYLIQYFVDQDRSVLASETITVTDVAASVTIPAEAEAGSEISVTWTGPDYERDFIGIGIVGAEGGNQWENYARTSDGNPLTLTVPTVPGEYLVQYFVDQDRTIIASASLQVTEVSARVTAPASAPAGSDITVTWAGPNYDRDFIGIGKVGATGGNQWQNYVRTSEGETLSLRVPAEPGDYLIQYFVDQDRSIIATATFTATPVKASITAPDTAVAGQTISLSWDGPDYERDFIGIGETNATGGGQWANYVHTSEGTTVDLLVPPIPGDYVIKYFIDQDRSVLFQHPITVTAVKAQLLAPDAAPAGSALVVGWDGPDYQGDFIGIGKAGATGGGRWQTYTRTSEGNPATVTLPEEPGDYVITYFVDQGRVPIATLPLRIE